MGRRAGRRLIVGRERGRRTLVLFGLFKLEYCWVDAENRMGEERFKNQDG